MGIGMIGLLFGKIDSAVGSRVIAAEGAGGRHRVCPSLYRLEYLFVSGHCHKGNADYSYNDGCDDASGDNVVCIHGVAPLMLSGFVQGLGLLLYLFEEEGYPGLRWFKRQGLRVERLGKCLDEGEESDAGEGRFPLCLHEKEVEFPAFCDQTFDAGEEIIA